LTRAKVGNAPVADSVAVSYGKLRAAGCAIVGNEHVAEDHHFDRLAVLENLSEATVLARGTFKSRRASAIRRRYRQ
jgi:hypothetical protein